MPDPEQQPAINAEIATGNITIPIPEQFNPCAPDSAEQWPKWIRRFQRYRIASGLSTKDMNHQVGTLLYAMGDCDNLITALGIDEDTISFDDIKKKFDEHYGVRRSVVADSRRFNRRVQGQEESVDSFIQDLYRMVEHCNYGTLKERMIRDRIIAGIRDEDVSDKLQLRGDDLTLDTTIKLVRQSEARK